MDAVKYIKEQKRMCDSYRNCGGCPIEQAKDTFCIDWILEYTNEAVALVERWSEEHPQKTLKDDFLEKFPNAEMREDGSLRSCLRFAYGFGNTKCIGNCVECWNKPLSEVE